MGEVLSRRSIHDGRIVKLFVERVLLPNGAQTDLEVIEHPGASTVLPFITVAAAILTSRKPMALRFRETLLSRISN